MKSPRRQDRQRPQCPPCQPTPTLCPDAQSSTYNDTASTIPTTSCPGTRGYWIPRKAPCLVNESLWQTPQAWTLMRTCRAVGSGTSRSTISKGPLALLTCTARMRDIATSKELRRLSVDRLPSAGRGFPFSEFRATERALPRAHACALRPVFRALHSSLRARLCVLQRGSRVWHSVLPTGVSCDKARQRPRELYLIFANGGIDIEKFPAIHSYLRQFETRLRPKP